MEKQKLIEVARSFSYKLALPGYSNVDFFCSEKVEVPENEAEEKSEELYNFCKKQVLNSIARFDKARFDEQIKMAKQSNDIEDGAKWNNNAESNAEKERRQALLEEAEREQKETNV